MINLHNMSLPELKELRNSIDIIIAAKEKELKEQQDMSLREEFDNYSGAIKQENNYYQKIVEENENYTVDEAKRITKVSSR